jgi:hypothetical protein
VGWTRGFRGYKVDGAYLAQVKRGSLGHRIVVSGIRRGPRCRGWRKGLVNHCAMVVGWRGGAARGCKVAARGTVGVLQ